MPETPLPGTGRILIAQLRYQLTLLTRTPAAFVFGLIMPAVLLVLELGRRHAAPATLNAAVGGLVVFGLLAIAYLTYAAGLVAAREAGVLRRWHATPVPAWGYFAGRIAAATVMADAAALILLGVSAALNGLHPTAAAVISLLVAVTAGAVTLASAGTAITPLLPSSQGANGILALSYLPLLFFSGGFGATASLPHWLTRAVTYLPVQPAVDAATRALAHPGQVPGRDLLVLASWTAGCLALSARYFRWDPTRPRHAGARAAVDRPSPVAADHPSPVPARELVDG
jgi:ABC-2 type transport system permease protein